MNNTNCITFVKSIWAFLVWFMTYYAPPMIAVWIAYHFGKKTFVREKEHDRKTLLNAKENEFVKNRYIIEGLDRVLSSFNWCLSYYNFNYSIAIEVEGRCKTERTSKNDNLEDLVFKPFDMLIDLSPFLRINNLIGDNIYFLLMQLVHARTETFYYSRCLDIMDLGKYILKNRNSATIEDYNANLKELGNLKESETNIFYRFHSIPFSLLVLTDAFEKSVIQGEPISNFRDNKIVKEEIQKMEQLFGDELKIYEKHRHQGEQLSYVP